MNTKVVYQTLEDRDSELNELEDSGPYPCDWENSWLGEGFYFWDTFIDNAHWWGEEVRKDYTNGYIICKAICDDNPQECFDLVGNTEHMNMMFDTFELMKEEGLANEKTTVKRVIEYLKTELKIFRFSATRVMGVRSKNYNSKYSYTQNFEENKKPYFDYKPPIQICFYRKNSMNLRDYHIVFPDKYSLDFI